MRTTSTAGSSRSTSSPCMRGLNSWHQRHWYSGHRRGEPDPYGRFVFNKRSILEDQRSVWGRWPAESKRWMAISRAHIGNVNATDRSVAARAPYCKRNVFETGRQHRSARAAATALASARACQPLQCCDDHRLTQYRRDAARGAKITPVVALQDPAGAGSRSETQPDG
jgi:hypothetical protein